MKNTDCYQGHLPDGSSIQAHSAGGLYPFVIYAQQVGAGLQWGVIAPGRAGQLVGSYDQAHNSAWAQRCAGKQAVNIQ